MKTKKSSSPRGDHQQLQRLAKNTEPERTLEVDANEISTREVANASMHPAEAIGALTIYPGMKPKSEQSNIHQEVFARMPNESRVQ